MDALGHLLLGIAVSGEATPYSLALSLAPDVSALPLQVKRVRENIQRYPRVLFFYQLCHSPIALLSAWFLPDPAFILVATHVVADLFSHYPPYSFMRIHQWNYRPMRTYLYLTATLGLTALARLYYFPGA